MSAANPFLERPRILRRVMFVVAAGLVSVAVLGMLVIGIRPKPSTGVDGEPHVKSTIQPEVSRTVPAVGSSIGAVRVVQGSELVNGLYVGFPHSTVGAISAADEYITALGSTLDPDRSASVARMAADPSYPSAMNDAAAGTQNTRTQLGIAENGSVPAGYTVDVNVEDYQLHAVGIDEVTVLLLAYYTTTSPDQGVVTRTAVFPMAVHWAQQDWRFLPMASGDYSALNAEPGSAQSAADGWIALIQ